MPAVDELEKLTQVWMKRQPVMRGAVLAIDGTLLPIEKPRKSAEDYWYRKDFYALNFLVACDPNYVVRFAYGAFPGSANDSRVLGYSGLVQ